HRCKAADAIAIPGAWCDIDIAGPAHAKAALPPDIASAVSLAESMPLPPSLFVHSGHGVYPLWLFKEAWTFAGDAERERAAALVRRWQALLNARGKERGWDLDGAADLARVLRLPGTVNRKLAPVPVTCNIPAPLRRYDPADLLDALPPEPRTAARPLKAR